jgi:hypothetical protein
MVDDQPQGRYLFVASPALAIMAAFALNGATSRLVSNLKAGLVTVCLTGTVLFDVVVVYVIEKSLVLR